MTTTKETLFLFSKGEVAVSRLRAFYAVVDAARFKAEDGEFLEALLLMDTTEFYTIAEALREAAKEQQEAQKAAMRATEAAIVGMEAEARRRFVEDPLRSKEPYLYGSVPGGLMGKYDEAQARHKIRIAPGNIAQCALCGEMWPCSTIQGIESEIEAAALHNPDMTMAAGVGRRKEGVKSPEATAAEPESAPEALETGPPLRSHGAPVELEDTSAIALRLSGPEEDNTGYLEYRRNATAGSASIHLSGRVNWDQMDRTSRVIKRHTPDPAIKGREVCLSCRELWPCQPLLNSEAVISTLLEGAVAPVDDPGTKVSEPEDLSAERGAIMEPAAPEAGPEHEYIPPAEAR